MSRPRLLDAFCGAGGAGRGYRNAGWDVTGVDIADHSAHYGGDRFIQGDAIEYIRKNGHRYDAVHASPPCQASCTLTKGTHKNRDHGHVDLIPQTRAVLADVGGPSVIENVAGAKLRKDLMLCGEMFGLDVVRHRFFELTNWSMPQPDHRPHRGRVRGWRHGAYYDGPYVAVYGNGGGKGTVPEWQTAMDIDWINDRKAIAEAIPPAYTEYIGWHLLEQL